MANPSEVQIYDAFKKCSTEERERSDPDGVWQWQPSPFEAFKLGYLAAIDAATPEGAQAVAWVNPESLSIAASMLKAPYYTMEWFKAWNTDNPSERATMPLYPHPARDAADAARLDWIEANPGLLIRHADQWVAATNHTPMIHHDLDMRCVIDKAIDAARAGAGGSNA